MIRRSIPAGLLLALLAGGGASALRAEEAPLPEVREAVETAWLEGRLEQIDELLPEEEPLAFPLALRDFVWRPEALTMGSARPTAARLLQAEIESSPKYDPARPLPEEAGGGEDPYPVLTALIRDRRLRETLGSAGLPEESPLLRLARRGGLSERQDDLTYYLAYQMRLVYTGRYPDDPEADAEQRRIERVAVALEERNGAWAFWSLLLFLGVPLLLGWRLGRGSS